MLLSVLPVQVWTACQPRNKPTHYECRLYQQRLMCCRPYVLPDHYTVPVVPGDFNAIDKPRGMLFVTIISAKNVPKMDWFNGSDPYVRCAICTTDSALVCHLPLAWIACVHLSTSPMAFVVTCVNRTTMSTLPG